MFFRGDRSYNISVVDLGCYRCTRIIWCFLEVIGAITSVLLIWVVTGVLVSFAVQRVSGQDFDIDVDVMLITSVCGVAVNIV